MITALEEMGDRASRGMVNILCWIAHMLQLEVRMVNALTSIFLLSLFDFPLTVIKHEVIG